MPDWHRRSILATGAALSAGSVLASVGVGASESDDGVDLPDPDLDSDPEPDEDWASYRGGPGHTGFVENGYDLDGESLEAAWSADHDGRVAVADGTVYTSNADGVVALDADDGSTVWENTDLDASDPVVADETVYLIGDEVVALDAEDGTVRWETDFEPEDPVSRHTVAYDAVYVVADGTLSALEAGDGSVRWEIDSVTFEHWDGEEQAYEFVRSPAAANGVVYAATEQTVLALEPETGAEVWRYDEGSYIDILQPIHANSTAVVVEWSTVEKAVHDPYTGEMERLIPFETSHDLGLDEEIYATGDHHGFYGGSIEGDEYGWDVSVAYNAGQPVISGDTVYVYFGTASGEWGDYDEQLVALDKYDGTEKWTLSEADAPVGLVRAISDGTLYVDHDGELVALREGTDDGDDEDDETDDEETKDDEDDGDDETDSDCPNEDTESDCPSDGDDGEEDDTGDGGGSGGSGGDEGGSGDDEGGSGDDGDEGNDESDDGTGGNGDDATDPEDEADDTDTDDGMPGFTTGAGIVGGAVGLEWLRRRADEDEPAE
ncbi:outer membrane protein assembly factor BamB family protein [Natronococcus wangiae]|uniref:outer membrane protein assembly factor BamB family protein n=1 Tax=Natronococcus wangiae TaxID=3068275 RepID=UPI00273ECEF9|nr:PQQ-binding-like beta-propeller repeat protein [Natronococcus sp. AD5]